VYVIGGKQLSQWRFRFFVLAIRPFHAGRRANGLVVVFTPAIDSSFLFHQVVFFCAY
jgi:hypothetical protein